MGILNFKKISGVWKEYAFMALGALIMAIAINVFMVPFKIAPGGVSGIATVVHYLSNKILPVGGTMLAFNIPLFLLGLKYVGRKFFVRTFFSTILLVVFIDGLEPYSTIFVKHYLLSGENPASFQDLMLYSVFGGALMGIGMGMVFKKGATTGGSDLAARVVNHFSRNFTMGQLIMAIDTVVISLAAVCFKSFVLALYSILTLYISSIVIDAILEGVNFAKNVFIISDNADEIAAKLLVEIDRGVTALRGIGMYTGKEKNVLMCVLHRGQLQQLKELVLKYDKNAFIILTDIREVLGEGFKTY